MDVRELRMFVAVAEEGSIRGGARRVVLAQPYLSQCLRKLERELGAELFVRSPRGVALTAAGGLLLSEARDLIDRLDRVTRAVRETARPRQKVRIGLMAGQVAAAELTGPILSTFRASNLDLDIEVHELSFADQFDAVSEGQVDVALVRPPTYDPRLAIHPLFEEPRVLCVGGRHALAEATDLSVTEFIDETFVELQRTDRRWAHFWMLDEMRGAEARTRADGSVTLSELQVTLLCEDVVVTAAASAWRLGMAHPMLRGIPVRDAPGSEVAVAVRDGEDRENVLAFVDAAREVTTEMIDLVPEGVLAD